MAKKMYVQHNFEGSSLQPQLKGRSLIMMQKLATSPRTDINCASRCTCLHVHSCLRPPPSSRLSVRPPVRSFTKFSYTEAVVKRKEWRKRESCGLNLRPFLTLTFLLSEGAKPKKAEKIASGGKLCCPAALPAMPACLFQRAGNNMTGGS